MTQPKNMKNRSREILVIAVALLTHHCSPAQNAKTLTIEACYQLAEKHYPLIRQYALIENAREYSVANAAKGYLPQIQLAGQMSYQSDVTRVPIALPNIQLPVLSKDQYKIYGEVLQPVSDLFTTVKYQKELAEANAEIEKQKLATDLYALKERINQLYFSILLIDEQLAQTDILKKDIQAGLNKSRIAVEQGVTLRRNLDLLQVEMLNVDQRAIELKGTRQGYSNMLAQFIGAAVNESLSLEKPVDVDLSDNIRRPELKLFQTQQHTYDIQSKLIRNTTVPRISIFLQGGYGKPGLDMLKNKFDTYYIGGIRFQWNISGFYTYKPEKQLLSIRRHTLDIQKENFLFNTQLALIQQNSEITKIRQLIQSDQEIISLRESIRRSAQNQLEYGTSTVNDYLSYLHAEDQARQNLVLHEIQLLMARYQYNTTAGN